MARRLAMEEISAVQRERDDEELGLGLGGGGFLSSSASGLRDPAFGGSSPSGAAAFGFGTSGFGGSAASTPSSTRCSCPHCGTPNEFPNTSMNQQVTVQCGSCQGQFQVNLPPMPSAVPSTASSSMSVRLCRGCGTMNQFPTPPLGQPYPDVRCGLCGVISRRRGRRRDGADRLVEQSLLDPHGTTAGGAGSTGFGGGPMVRVTVGGQRRSVPLGLLLALMAEEADKSTAANASDIAALPTQKLSNLQHLGEQTKCLICLDEFQDSDELKTLPCLHIYHHKCVDRWLCTDNSCPVCKTPIGQVPVG